MLHRLALPLAILALAPASASAAGWLAASPVPLTSAQSADSKIAIAGSGRGAAAWLELEGTTVARIMVATYQHGSGVSAAVPLSTQNLNGYSGPELAVSPKGDTLVAWRESSSTIRAATRGPDAESFTPATGILTTTNISRPVVATLDDGTFVIAWVDGTTVRLAVRHPGDASFTTTTVPGLGSVHNLALAAAPGGGAALAITDLLNGQGRLMLSIAPAGGSFGTPSVAATVDAAADYELQGVGLAYGAGGKLGVGFVEHHNGAGELYGLTGDANGAVGFASPIPGTTWTSLSDVQVSFASDGTEAIAYQGVQGAVPKGRLAVASPGGAWSTVPAWPAGVDPGAVRVASVGSQLVALSGSSGDGLAGGVVPNLASQGTAVPGSVDVVDSIAAHGADAVATVMHKADGAYHVEAFTWDGTPPVISDLTAPASAIAGVAAPFHASASDALSAASVRWSFGDGETATGDNATHAFATAGTFTVTATATDGAGNTTTRSADVSVATPAPPAATKLQFLSAKVNRAHTAVRWTLNLPASVSATIKRGTRVVSVTKHRAGTAGSAGVRRSHGRPLRRGRYRIVLRARDTSGLAATRTIKLRVR